MVSVRPINSCHHSESALPMQKGSTIFLQVVIVLISMCTLAFLLWEPHLEGRNAHATPFEIYFNDPFLAYVYVASIAIFVALYQAFKLLSLTRQNKVFSQSAVKAVRMIKWCAISFIGFIAVSVLFMPYDDLDDRPPGVVMRVFFTFGSLVVATAAAMFERLLQNGLDIKSENDLTV